MTTVETATAVLYGLLFRVASAPNTAAAPHIPLPTDVKRAIPRSIFRSFPM